MSTLRVTTLQDASGVERFTARAWVNFNGTGTVAIRASGNVSSITDNGTGDYTINFTNALPDQNYIFVCGQTVTGVYVNGPYYLPGNTKTTTAIRLITYSYTPGTADNSDVYVAFFR